MQTNEISAKLLNADAQSWIAKLRQVLLIQDKGKGTVKNYTAEMVLLFKYYNSKTVATYLNHNGRLVNIQDLTRRTSKNKASPPINKTGSSKGL